MNTDVSKINFPSQISTGKNAVTKEAYLDAIKREYEYAKNGSIPLTVNVKFVDGTSKDLSHANFEQLATKVFQSSYDQMISQLPAYCTVEHGKVMKEDFIDATKRCISYEKTNGASPTTVNVAIEGGPTPPQPNNTDCSYVSRYLSNASIRQDTQWYCGPNSVQQSMYKLTGKFFEEKYIASIAGTTQSGTDHPGLNRAISRLATESGIRVSVQWKRFNTGMWPELKTYMSDTNVAIFFHNMYRNKWGHYEFPIAVCTTSKIVQIANSLSGGYIEKRPFATMQSYFNGIGQPQVCIIRKL